MSEPIILTTGIYDLIKDQIRRKQVTKAEENLLIAELKTAKQVLRKQLPNDVVTVNKRVSIKNHTDNTEQSYSFVAGNKAKVQKGRYWIGSNIAIATVGRKVGDIFNWPFKDGERKIEILSVEELY